MAEAELTTIARPYARAAFRAALDATDGLSQWARMLALLRAAVNEDSVREALADPLLTTTDESALLLSLLGEELDTQGQNFVTILAEYDRLVLLPTIADLFDSMKANHEKTMEVAIESAYDVDESAREKLAAALHARLQRDVVLTTTVDSELIGGVIIRAGDTVIDNSVRGKLERLANVLT